MISVFRLNLENNAELKISSTKYVVIKGTINMVLNSCCNLGHEKSSIVIYDLGVLFSNGNNKNNLPIAFSPFRKNRKSKLKKLGRYRC